MNVAIVESRQFLRPTTVPLKSSVLDHVRAAGNLHEVAESTGFGWVNDNGVWVSYNELETLTPTPLCPDPQFIETGDFKTFGFAEWVPALTFAVHGGVQCKTVGLDVKDMQAEIARVFERNEGRGVEEALLGNRFVAQAADPVDPLAGSWAAPTDITPADDVSPRVAIGLLEGWAARHYAGVPTLHMPRALGAILGSDVISWEGDLAFTKMGSKIAFGGGYDEEDQDGTFDIYATGEVMIERSATFTINTFNLTENYSGSDESGIEPNTALALVERMFRVAVDGFVVKATGTVPAVTGGGFAS